MVSNLKNWSKYFRKHHTPPLLLLEKGRCEICSKGHFFTMNLLNEDFILAITVTTNLSRFFIHFYLLSQFFLNHCFL